MSCCHSLGDCTLKYFIISIAPGVVCNRWFSGWLKLPFKTGNCQREPTNHLASSFVAWLRPKLSLLFLLAKSLWRIWELSVEKQNLGQLQMVTGVFTADVLIVRKNQFPSLDLEIICVLNIKNNTHSSFFLEWDTYLKQFQGRVISPFFGLFKN